MKRLFVLTMMVMLMISFKGMAGFLDSVTKKINDVNKAIEIKRVPREEAQKEEVQKDELKPDDDPLVKMDIDTLISNAYKNKDKNIELSHKYIETAYNRLSKEYYDAQTETQLYELVDQIRYLHGACHNLSMDDLKEKCKKCIDDFSKLQKKIRENEKIVKEKEWKKEQEKQEQEENDRIDKLYLASAEEVMTEMEVRLKAFKDKIDVVETEKLFDKLLEHSSIIQKMAQGDKNKETINDFIKVANWQVNDFNKETKANPETMKKIGKGYREDFAKYKAKMNSILTQQQANYVLIKALESNSPLVKLYKMGLSLSLKNGDEEAGKQLPLLLETKQGMDALKYLDSLEAEYQKHPSDGMVSKAFDFARKTIQDKIKNDPAFMYPHRDVCNSEILLYKNLKSGMNKMCVMNDKMTKSSSILEDVKNGLFFSQANNYGNSRSMSHTDTPEVDFIFAHKNVNDSIGVLVQVCVYLRSPDVEFNDIVSKYSKQLGMDSPKITPRVVVNNKLNNDIGMELGYYQVTEKMCILESNGLKITIMEHVFDVKFNEKAKKLMNEEDRNVLVLQFKQAIDNKIDTQAKKITVTDVKQFEAYHQLYLQEKNAEKDKETQHKNQRKKQQLDF